MQTSLIPNACCDDLDRSARDFLWGSSSERRKMHLVAWDKVCSKKERGGLGLRHAFLQNKALMMKIGWGLVVNKDALWARVVRSKYDCGDDLIPNIRKGVKGSRVWSGINGTWEEVAKGLETVDRQGERRVRWKLDRSGTFSVKSAYAAIAKEPVQVERWWRDVWKARIPHRCKFFMWLTLHDRLLVNERLFRRHLHPDGMCVVCSNSQETLLHALRDCSQAKEVWKGLGVLESDRTFWDVEDMRWLKTNVRLNRRREFENWNALFCVGCWLIWRRRNEFLHHGSCPSFREGVAEVRGIVQCMLKARCLLAEPQIRNRNWEKPTRVFKDDETILVRVDGAYSQGSLMVGCGGIIERPNGNIVDAFTYVGSGDASIVAELWACIWGLRRAWDSGHRNVVICCDAMEVIDEISGRTNDLHVDVALFGVIREMLERDWQARIQYIDRQENAVADLLASKSFTFGMGLHLMTESQVMRLVRESEDPG